MLYINFFSVNILLQRIYYKNPYFTIKPTCSSQGVETQDTCAITVYLIFLFNFCRHILSASLCENMAVGGTWYKKQHHFDSVTRGCKV